MRRYKRFTIFGQRFLKGRVLLAWAWIAVLQVILLRVKDYYSIKNNVKLYRYLKDYYNIFKVQNLRMSFIIQNIVFIIIISLHWISHFTGNWFWPTRSCNLYRCSWFSVSYRTGIPLFSTESKYNFIFLSININFNYVKLICQPFEKNNYFTLYCFMFLFRCVFAVCLNFF